MELLLVSGTRTVIESYVCKERLVSFDYVFDLMECNELPSPSVVELWNNELATPLRDRLMIEWVFFHSEAAQLQDVIVHKINALLTEAEEKAGLERSLRIAVICATGCQLSPCFVEKLFEHFSAAYSARYLVVKRDHPTICRHLRKASANGTPVVWQHSNSSQLSQTFSNIHILTKMVSTASKWNDFSSATNTMLEASFQRDPLSSSSVVGVAIANFQDGILRTQRAKMCSFLRCVPRSTAIVFKAVVHQINLKQYKSYVNTHAYQAAGILPYSVHPVSGEPIFLIGKITYGTQTWCDFGGLKSQFPIFKSFQMERLSLRESPEETAARECYEETLGIFGDTVKLLHDIRDHKTNNIFKVINEDHSYVGHFLKVPYDNYPDKFVSILQHATSYVEVEKMRWISISSIKRAVKEKLACVGLIAVSPINERDGNSDCLEHLCLREEFVGSLYIADKLGVLQSITVIAKRMHSSLSYSSSSTSFLVSKLTSLTVTLDPNESKMENKQRSSESEKVNVKDFKEEQGGDNEVADLTTSVVHEKDEPLPELKVNDLFPQACSPSGHLTGRESEPMCMASLNLACAIDRQPVYKTDSHDLISSSLHPGELSFSASLANEFSKCGKLPSVSTTRGEQFDDQEDDCKDKKMKMRTRERRRGELEILLYGIGIGHVIRCVAK